MDPIGGRDETIGANGKTLITVMWALSEGKDMDGEEGEDRRRDRVVFNETDFMVKSTQTLWTIADWFKTRDYVYHWVEFLDSLEN